MPLVFVCVSLGFGAAWAKSPPPESAAGLSIAASADPRGQLTITLTNVSEKELTVMSHVATHETHLDWFTVELRGGPGGTRTIFLDDKRDKSAPVSERLAPGEKLVHVVDLLAWAARPRNGGKPLAKGTYSMRVNYRVDGENKAWKGTISVAGSVTFE